MPPNARPTRATSAPAQFPAAQKAGLAQRAAQADPFWPSRRACWLSTSLSIHFRRAFDLCARHRRLPRQLAAQSAQRRVYGRACARGGRRERWRRRPFHDNCWTASMRASSCSTCTARSGILASSDLPPAVDEVYDLREPDFVASLTKAIRTLFAPKDRVITILGRCSHGRGGSGHHDGRSAPHQRNVQLFRAAADYDHRHVDDCREPRHHCAERHGAASRAPTDDKSDGNWRRSREPRRASSSHPAAITRSARSEAALAIMQDALVRELNQKKAFGRAWARGGQNQSRHAQHAASAQLLSDRLANVTDPLAQRLAQSWSRRSIAAIRFCQATLTYGRAIDDPPKLSRFALRPLVDEACRKHRRSTRAAQVQIVNKVAEEVEVVADARAGIPSCSPISFAMGWRRCKAPVRRRAGPRKSASQQGSKADRNSQSPP